MSEHNDGGPAFPNPALANESCQFQVDVTGLTVRDYFAAQALAGMGVWSPSPSDFPSSEQGMRSRAEWSYRQADAMLTAREPSR